MFGLELVGAVTLPGWVQFVEILRAILTLLISLTGSPGLAIILFTVAIRALLVPLAVYSHRANQRMQALKPKLEKLQRRYRHDRQKLSVETIRLYRENRINPYATILPALIQIPLLIGLPEYHGGRRHGDAGLPLAPFTGARRSLAPAPAPGSLVPARAGTDGTPQRTGTPARCPAAANAPTHPGTAAHRPRLRLGRRRWPRTLLGNTGSIRRDPAILPHRLGRTPRLVPDPARGSAHQPTGLIPLADAQHARQSAALYLSQSSHSAQEQPDGKHTAFHQCRSRVVSRSAR